MKKTGSKKVSLFRLRLGIVLFILWWIPIYLTLPLIDTELNLTTKKSQTIVALAILTIQGIIGIIGLLLVGKELALTLKRVKTKKLPITVWRMIWSGNSDVKTADLKPKKSKKKTTKSVSSPKASTSPTSPDLVTMLKSKEYIRLLVIAAIIGVPISAAAYFFLQFIDHLQVWVYNSLPLTLGFHETPRWWSILPLIVASILVGITIKYFRGAGGHIPADGFHAGGYPLPIELPGIILAATASIGLGAVIGPEAPLIAIGGGLGYIAIKLLKKDVPSKTAAIFAATGSFAAISTLFGSPLLGAFLLMEASGLGGETATLALLPGLLGAGIGSLIFLGLGSLTGLGTVSLVIPNLPFFAHPNIAEFGWAFVIGIVAAIVGTLIKRFGLLVRDQVAKRTIPIVISSGILIAVLAIGYSFITGHNPNDVLFSGQSALPYFISHPSNFSLAAISVLLITKSIAYGLSLGSFRGGPVFPSMFLGTIIGIALSHFAGLPEIPAIAMGIGAMAVTMLRLPFTSVLLATLLLFSAGLAVMPLVIVAVVVAFVVSTRILPKNI